MHLTEWKCHHDFVFCLPLTTITYVSIYNTSVHCQRRFRAVFVLKSHPVNNISSFHLKSFNSYLTCRVFICMIVCELPKYNLTFFKILIIFMQLIVNRL